MDDLLVGLARWRERIAIPMARIADELDRRGSWELFGCTSKQTYAKVRLGRCARWLSDLATLGRGLRQLPQLDRAVGGDDGQLALGRTAAVLVGRIATVGTAARWIELARSMPYRDFAKCVREARAQGDAQHALPPPNADSLHPNEKGKNAKPPEEANSGKGPGATSNDERSEVTLYLPGAMQVATYEVHDVHSAASGRTTSKEDFVQALVAESMSSAHPPELDHGELEAAGHPLQAGRPVSEIEAGLARETNNWQALDETPHRCAQAEPELLALFGDSARLFAELNELEREAAVGHTRELHRKLCRLIRLEDIVERQIGEYLGQMSRRKAWKILRFDGVGHYAEKRLGMARRTAEDRARAANELRRLPVLQKAYSRGRIGLEAVLIVLRILGPYFVSRRTQRAWVFHALRHGVKRLRDESRALEREGYLQEDAPGQTYPNLDPNLGRTPPMPMSDEAWQRSLARVPGTAQKRIERLARHCSRELTGAVGYLFRLRVSTSTARDFLGAIEDRRLRLVEDPGSLTQTAAAVALARMFSKRGLPIPQWLGLLALLEEYLAVWDAPELMPKRGNQIVYAIFGFRCAAPGCTRRCKLHDHHLEFRSHGGCDALWNRLPLCEACHLRGVHQAGTIYCKGRAPLDVIWCLGRGELALWFKNEKRIRPMPDATASD